MSAEPRTILLYPQPDGTYSPTLDTPQNYTLPEYLLRPMRCFTGPIEDALRALYSYDNAPADDLMARSMRRRNP